MKIRAQNGNQALVVECRGALIVTLGPRPEAQGFVLESTEGTDQEAAWYRRALPQILFSQLDREGRLAEVLAEGFLRAPIHTRVAFVRKVEEMYPLTGMLLPPNTINPKEAVHGEEQSFQRPTPGPDGAPGGGEGEPGPWRPAPPEGGDQGEEEPGRGGL